MCNARLSALQHGLKSAVFIGSADKPLAERQLMRFLEVPFFNQYRTMV